MATKFFTNADSNTLLNKLEGVFRHGLHIEEFDALVGYFRSTGYFKIRPFLENVSQIMYSTIEDSRSQTRVM